MKRMTVKMILAWTPAIPVTVGVLGICDITAGGRNEKTRTHTIAVPASAEVWPGDQGPNRGTVLMQTHACRTLLGKLQLLGQTHLFELGVLLFHDILRRLIRKASDNDEDEDDDDGYNNESRGGSSSDSEHQAT